MTHVRVCYPYNLYNQISQSKLFQKEFVNWIIFKHKYTSKGQKGVDRAYVCTCMYFKAFSRLLTTNIGPPSLEVWTDNFRVSAQLLSPLGSRQSFPAYFQFLVSHFSMMQSRCSQRRSFLGRTLLSRSATIWPYSRHRNRFCFNFSLMMNKGQKQARHKFKFSSLNICQRVILDLISMVFILDDCAVVWL